MLYRELILSENNKDTKQYKAKEQRIPNPITLGCLLSQNVNDSLAC